MQDVRKQQQSSVMAAAIAWLALAGGPSCAQEATVPRDSATDALSGHQAEQLQFGAAADPLRRPLFFDPVDIESAPVGVPCNHLLRRRPDKIAGSGFVVLLRSADGHGPSMRFWAAPGMAHDAAEAVAMARSFAAAHAPHSPVEIVALRAFAWCR